MLLPVLSHFAAHPPYRLCRDHTHFPAAPDVSRSQMPGRRCDPFRNEPEYPGDSKHRGTQQYHQCTHFPSQIVREHLRRKPEHLPPRSHPSTQKCLLLQSAPHPHRRNNIHLCRMKPQHDAKCHPVPAICRRHHNAHLLRPLHRTQDTCNALTAAKTYHLNPSEHPDLKRWCRPSHKRTFPPRFAQRWSEPRVPTDHFLHFPSYTRKGSNNLRLSCQIRNYSSQKKYNSEHFLQTR